MGMELRRLWLVMLLVMMVDGRLGLQRCRGRVRLWRVLVLGLGLVLGLMLGLVLGLVLMLAVLHVLPLLSVLLMMVWRRMMMVLGLLLLLVVVMVMVVELLVLRLVLTRMVLRNLRVRVSAWGRRVLLLWLLVLEVDPELVLMLVLVQRRRMLGRVWMALRMALWMALWMALTVFLARHHLHLCLWLQVQWSRRGMMGRNCRRLRLRLRCGRGQVRWRRERGGMLVWFNAMRVVVVLGRLLMRVWWWCSGGLWRWRQLELWGRWRFDLGCRGIFCCRLRQSPVAPILALVVG